MPVGPQRQRSYLNPRSRSQMAGGETAVGRTRLIGVTTSERGDPTTPLMGSTKITLGGIRPDAPLVGRTLHQRLKQSAEPSKSTTVDKSGRYPAITSDRKISGGMGEVIGEAGRPAGKYRRGGEAPPTPQYGRRTSSINREGLMGLTAISGSTTMANAAGIPGIVHAGPAGRVRKGTPGDSRSKHSSLHLDVGRSSTSVRTAPLTRTVGYVTGPAGPYRRGKK